MILPIQTVFIYKSVKTNKQSVKQNGTEILELHQGTLSQKLNPAIVLYSLKFTGIVSYCVYTIYFHHFPL